MREFIYKPPTDPIDIIYHDEDILILNKPAGLLSVPGKPETHQDCLWTRAKQQFPKATVVHRLDCATSGIMVMALHIEAHRHLSKQFAARRTKKTYIAKVWGIIEKDEGHIDLPLICDWDNRPLQKVDFEVGKSAQTDWQVIKREENLTTVRLFPITGRSHQLRVHMLELGHPILGDNFYAHDDAFNASDRLCLHAETLSFLHPEIEKECSFTAYTPF